MRPDQMRSDKIQVRLITCIYIYVNIGWIDQLDKIDRLDKQIN